MLENVTECYRTLSVLEVAIVMEKRRVTIFDNYLRAS